MSNVREHDRHSHPTKIRVWYPRFQEWMTIEEYLYRKQQERFSNNETDKAREE